MDILLAPGESVDLPPIAEYQAVEFACAPAGSEQLVLRVGGQELEPFLRPGETTWRWRWNPGAAVGLHQIGLLIADRNGLKASYSWTLRVLARKIDQDRYEALIDDIQRAAYGLAASLAGASAEGAVLDRTAPWRQSPAEEYYALFEERLDRFAQAVRRVARRPREQLRAADEQLPLGEAGEWGPSAIARLPQGQFDAAPADVAAELQAALRPGGGVLPRSVATSRGRPTTDIYEHQLLKHILTLLSRRARAAAVLAEREAARLTANELYTGAPSNRRLRVEQIAAGCAAAQHTLRELRGLAFLAEVRPLAAFHGSTPLLQRDAAYREIYHMWQALRQRPALAFDSPLFALPIAELPQLYESWCAIQVAQALLSLGGEVREQRLAEQRPTREGQEQLELVVSLSERAPLLVIERAACTLTLRYQPKYRPVRDKETKRQGDSGGGNQFVSLSPNLLVSQLRSLDRHTRIPDLAIEIRPNDGPLQVLLLDAKYRLDAHGGGVPEDALADAYTYLGAIGQGGARATLGALLLYPGTGKAERYPSGVGSIPLLPGRVNLLHDLLAEYLPC